MMGESAAVVDRISKRKKSILIGTMDRNIEEILEQQLDGLRYHLKIVRKGSEVLLHILENDVDLVILDMDVSGPLGFDILPIIRKTRPRLPVIVISTDYTFQLRRAVAQEGINCQMLKPVETKEMELITNTVHQLLGNLKHQKYTPAYMDV